METFKLDGKSYRIPKGYEEGDLLLTSDTEKLVWTYTGGAVTEFEHKPLVAKPQEGVVQVPAGYILLEVDGRYHALSLEALLIQAGALPYLRTETKVIGTSEWKVGAVRDTDMSLHPVISAGEAHFYNLFLAPLKEDEE
jgi:hypothetical protein